MDNFIYNIQEDIKSKQDKNFIYSLFQNFFAPQNETNINAGLYIYGGVGRGKSMLMNLFYENAPLTRKLRIHFHEFMQDIHSKLKIARQNDLEDPILHIANEIADKIDFICFDELQITDITDAMVVGRLFDALLKHKVHFIITSNRIPSDLYKNGLNRQLFLPFIKMIETKFEVIKLDHDTDYRSTNLMDIQKYFTPLGPRSKTSFNIMETSYKNSEPQEKILLNQSRKIIIDKTFQNIAIIDFNDFCNNNFGVSDYLLIAKEFDTLIFNNIPKLSSEMRNQATRFRNFIDAIYEAQNKVYFIADIEANQLYEKGDFSFEFERTISRIKEITSIK